jgi:hypothetical protein
MNDPFPRLNFLYTGYVYNVGPERVLVDTSTQDHTLITGSPWEALQTWLFTIYAIRAEELHISPLARLDEENLWDVAESFGLEIKPSRGFGRLLGSV